MPLTRDAFVHRLMDGGGAGGLQPSQNLGNLDFLGRKRKFGQSQLLKKFACVCACCSSFDVGVVKPVKFTRDSSCLTRDEFVIFEGDHIMIYMYMFLLLLGTVLHCST